MYESHYHQLNGLLQAHQSDLSQRLWHVVDACCNLEVLLPSQLQHLVQSLTNSFFIFLHDPCQVIPEHLGEVLNNARVTPTFLLLTNKALRNFCLVHLPEEQRLLGLEAAADFFLRMMQAYIQINQGVVAANILRKQEQKELLARFSAKEMATLHYLAQGMNNKQIAKAMDVSGRSVVNYLRQIRQKLGTTSRSETLVAALKLCGH
jgi:DNA-binding CsgD family transcriptional regulator